MMKPQHNSRSEAETDPANAGPKGRLKGVNHTMNKELLFVGLDVHAQAITVVVTEGVLPHPAQRVVLKEAFARLAVPRNGSVD